jgi:hypothetical protein
MNITVVWDVDDVLNDLTRAWLTDSWRPEHPASRVEYEDLTANPPHTVVGIKLDEYLASLDRFRLGPGYGRLVPQPAIREWLGAHGTTCRHVALTATPLHTAPSTAEWVLREFGTWIREFAFIPSRRPGEMPPSYDADKGAWMARMATPCVLVDDSEENLAAAEEAGVMTLCWPRPWNKGRRDVPEVLAALARLARGEEKL